MMDFFNLTPEDRERIRVETVRAHLQIQENLRVRRRLSLGRRLLILVVLLGWLITLVGWLGILEGWW